MLLCCIRLIVTIKWIHNKALFLCCCYLRQRNLRCLLSALTSYLNSVHEVDFPPDQYWYCAVSTMFLWNSSLCSALFILSMIFDRFYSIIRPHKAASFNTVKRAKITIVSIIVFSSLFNVPYLFAMTTNGRQCMNDKRGSIRTFFHWMCYVAQFVIPFLCLLAMNSVIIHTLRKRSDLLEAKNQGQGYGQGQKVGQSRSKSKSAERQIYAILILVAFSFFIFITPMCLFNVFGMIMDLTRTPYDFAEFYMFKNIVHKLHFTNNGVNFFLYVISGRKFRSDLIKLLHCKKNKHDDVIVTSTTSTTNVSVITSQ